MGQEGVFQIKNFLKEVYFQLLRCCVINSVIAATDKEEWACAVKIDSTLFVSCSTVIAQQLFAVRLANFPRKKCLLLDQIEVEVLADLHRESCTVSGAINHCYVLVFNFIGAYHEAAPLIAHIADGVRLLSS